MHSEVQECETRHTTLHLLFSALCFLRSSKNKEEKRHTGDRCADTLMYLHQDTVGEKNRFSKELNKPEKDKKVALNQLLLSDNTSQLPVSVEETRVKRCVNK